MDPTTLGMIVSAASSGLDATTVIVGLISAAAAIVVSAITNRVAGRASRRDAMLQWANQLQASEQAARKEARESEDRAERIRDEADADVARLRAQITELEGRLERMTKVVGRFTDTLTSVQAEVWRPEPDIPALRRLVGRPSPPAVNGRTV
ncbi:hypothetical protein [Micromonospora carbonacea]|uniref:Uncharacterized protein n=1 Tax=Micromonospora carbonacea TaxID=47853 RepID=A0A1C5ABN9_9ACTN|nr:hypothetical protein [Micromonospora carbonacea]SCF42623.1 hypothetical protein GA0070563_112105 [Micromonospora carbonacea]